MSGRLVPGHSLEWEGAPHHANGSRIFRQGVGGEGRAKCSCGDLSEDLPSAYQRKAWHREHKAEVVRRPARLTLAEQIEEMCVEAVEGLMHGSDYYDEPVVPVSALRVALEEAR